jgi:D-alanyl-D-alanine carboxypeptidase
MLHQKSMSKNTIKHICLLTAVPLMLVFSCPAQNIDPVLAAKLQNATDSFRLVHKLRGISVGVFMPGKGTWQGVGGMSHPGTPITSDMEFGIGSNTKLFTGVLLLKLVEQGRIRLDDSLHTYLPSYRNINPNITIRQLLNHTSGLDDVTSVAGYPDSILNNPIRIFKTGELISWAGPPLYAPGKGWNYCNTNYLLAGMIAERVTGFSYGQLLRDSILQPLNLDSTFLDVYDSVLFTVAHPWQAGTDNSGVPRKALNSAAWAAGAMYSTSGEMLQWYRALMGGKVLKPASLKEMTTFVGSGDYGIGISRTSVNGRTVWQHGGNIWGGYNSSMMFDSASGVVVCVLINQLPAQAFQLARALISTAAEHKMDVAEMSGEQIHLHVYPNPANGLVHIKAPGLGFLRISVFNAAGQQVMECTETSFSVAELPSGLYTIRAETLDGSRQYRLMKQ